ncbi:hypothetical protein HY491_02215 [Candidatus Woesearchaeota archaeon]|nr:hypothetical protein [Candidatus Woesearchaeota archaeon]
MKEKRSENIYTLFCILARRFPSAAVLQIYILILIILSQATIVRAPTSAAEFAIGQSAPFDPTGPQVQDADVGCGGNNFDLGNPANLSFTTHMLNATLRWNESDVNGDSVSTFICLASTKANIDAIDSSPQPNATYCDLLNLWNESAAVNDNTTGIRLPNKRDNGTGVGYYGETNLSFGALMAFDGQTTNNRSNIIKFNVSIINHFPTIEGFNTTATHSQFPSLGWRGIDYDDGTGADRCPRDGNLTFTVHVGDNSTGTHTNTRVNETNLGTNVSVTNPLPWNLTLNDAYANRTYFVLLNATDQLAGVTNSTTKYSFMLTDYIPTRPNNFNVTSVHNQSFHVSWNSSLELDGDSILYHIVVGITENGSEIFGEFRQASNKSDNIFNLTLNYSTDGLQQGWANETYYVTLWANNTASGIDRGNYTTSFLLYDNLPDITDVYMSDNNNLAIYTNCSKSASCVFTPTSGTNITLAVNITTLDTDADCDVKDYGKLTLYLCLNSTAKPNCGEITNTNFTIPVDTVSRKGSSTSCQWIFTTNLTNVTPQFFVANSSYLYHINATSQSMRRSLLPDNESNGTWQYNALKATNFPASITVGDGTIALEEWNPGTTNYTMTNYGNQIVFLRWNSTDFTRSLAAKNWTLQGWDFLLDDDTNATGENNETQSIPPLNITNTTAGYFNHSTGLVVCAVKECDSIYLNETMNTNWHIYPVAGLGAGTYSATITYVVE